MSDCRNSCRGCPALPSCTFDFCLHFSLCSHHTLLMRTNAHRSLHTTSYYILLHETDYLLIYGRGSERSSLVWSLSAAYHFFLTQKTLFIIQVIYSVAKATLFFTIWNKKVEGKSGYTENHLKRSFSDSNLCFSMTV